jgi:signal recognition particle GTPase
MLLWGDDVEFKVLESQNKICSAFSEDEKNEEKKLSKQDKQEISEVAQLEINDINDVLQKHSQMKGFHKFLK